MFDPGSRRIFEIAQMKVGQLRNVPVRLSTPQFESLAYGYGDSDALHLLSAGQASRRRLLVLAVVQAARDARLAAEASADDALTIMTTAERAAPASAGHVLDHPQVAVWATRCLRRLVAAGQDRSGLIAELGYLAALSAAAATRAGIDFEISLPTNGNTIFLPTLGTALASGGRRITVRGVAGVVTIVDRTRPIVITAAEDEGLIAKRQGAHTQHGDGPDRWLPTRIVSADEDGQRLRLTIEDGDPYRDGYRLPPAGRLADADLARFTALLADAWSWIVRHVPAHALSIGAILRSVVPLQPVARSRTKHVSATSRSASGSIAMSMPVDPETLALTLVHEVQHAKLGALLDLVDLYRDENGALYRAPWRMDPRPLGALMQGTYAHLGVTDYWRARGHDDSPGRRLTRLEFAYWRRRVGDAVETLSSSGALVPAGEHFVACMAATLRAWDRELIEPAITEAASGAHGGVGSM
jgi:HEXXH motif-containing protein